MIDPNNGAIIASPMPMPQGLGQEQAQQALQQQLARNRLQWLQQMAVTHDQVDDPTGYAEMIRRLRLQAAQNPLARDYGADVSQLHSQAMAMAQARAQMH